MSLIRYVVASLTGAAIAMGMSGCSAPAAKSDVPAVMPGMCFKDSCCSQQLSLSFAPHRLRCEALGAEKTALWAQADRGYAESIRQARAATGEQTTSGKQVLCLALMDAARIGDAQGKVDRAVDQYGEAVKVCLGAFGDKSDEYAKAQIGLTNARIDSGRLDEASSGIQNLMDISRLHDDQGLRAAALDAAGRLEDRRGDHSQARNLLKQSLELRKKVFGERSIESAHTMVHLGDNAMLLRGWADARGWYLRALDTIEISVGRRNRYFFNAKSALAAAYMRDRQYDALPPVYNDLITLSRDLYGTQSEEYAGTLNDSAAMLYMQKQYQQAFERFAQVVSIRRQTMPNSLLLGWTDMNAAKSKLEVSSCGPVRAYLQEAQSIISLMQGSSDPELPDYIAEYKRVSQLCMAHPDTGRAAPEPRGKKKR